MNKTTLENKGYPAKSADFVGRGAAAERVSFRPLAEANDTQALNDLSEKLTRECDSLFVNEELVLTELQKEAYTTVGGTPHLDGQYTVFGEVIEGLDVLDKIAAVKTNDFDRPVKDVVIKRITK